MYCHVYRTVVICILMCVAGRCLGAERNAGQEAVGEERQLRRLRHERQQVWSAERFRVAQSRQEVNVNTNLSTRHFFRVNHVFTPARKLFPVQKSMKILKASVSKTPTGLFLSGVSLTPLFLSKGGGCSPTGNPVTEAAFFSSESRTLTVFEPHTYGLGFCLFIKVTPTPAGRRTGVPPST